MRICGVKNFRSTQCKYSWQGICHSSTAVATVFALALFMLITTSIAAESSDIRESMIDSFSEQHTQNPSLYQSPPIYHIVPTQNTVTYAGQFELINFTLKPPSTSPTNQIGREELVLMTGNHLEAYLALSLKNICIGFSVEREKLASEYLNRFSPPYGSFEQRQNSSVEVSGLGLNGAWVLLPKLSKNIKFALILSSNNLNVRHLYSDVKSSNSAVTIDSDDSQTMRYVINKYAVGLNLNWKILRHFSIIPWSDYTYKDLKDGKNQLKTMQQNNENKTALIENDWNLFFLSYPKFRYGIDLGVNLFGIDLRVGGLLGNIANLNKKTETITDSSILLTLSFEQKGN